MQIPKRRAQMLRTHAMSDKINYVTADGLEKLKTELHELKTVKQRELAERLDAARQLGDLSENAEYQEAKHQLGMVQTRILVIAELLKNVVVIEKDGGGAVSVGSVVTVAANGKQKEYHIVGSNEADPTVGRISNESPLGTAFLGHVKGDAVSVTTPGGTTVYQITDVR
jgi:transcription elongation factor GreA